MNYEEFLKHFRVKSRYRDRAQCVCPSHDDKQASLTITAGQKGILLHCHAGCALESVLEAAHLKKSDLFYDEQKPHTSWRSYIEQREGRAIEAVYQYFYCNGSPAFCKVRLAGKKFIYGTLRDGRFQYGLPKPRRELPVAVYGDLKALEQAISEGKTTFYCEGEKDTQVMAKQGYAAITAGSVNDWRPAVARLYKGADVAILADNDQPGQNLAERVLADLQGVAQSARIITPMPDVPHGDVSDYFATGHSREELEQLIRHSATITEKPYASLPDLSQFHHCNENGKITGVYDFAIFQYLKSEHDLFVLGGTAYLYAAGVYVADESGARLKTMIRELIYPAFIKSTTIKRIYELFISAAELQATFEDVNQYPPYWINFQNGFYDTKARRIVPHDPKYRAINQIPHEYRPEAIPEGRAVETWLQFICPEADDREMLLQFMGLTLTKDVSQQKFLVLCGEGGSGKSTLIRLNEAMTGSQNISNISLTELQQRFASFGLMGKLLNSCADLEIVALEDTSTLKKVLGEDSLRGEQKGRDAISFKSYAKLIFSTNELPLVKAEKTNGFYRRLLVLPMNKVPEKKNADLFAELAAEIDYFIKLSVEALERLYKAGTITESRASVAAVNQLRCDSDTVQAFITEICSLGHDFRAERVTMYRKYGKFCEDNERQPLKKTAFLKSVRSKGFTEIKSSGDWYFLGISLEKKIPYDSPENSPDEFLNLPKDCQEALPFD